MWIDPAPYPFTTMLEDHHQDVLDELRAVIDQKAWVVWTEGPDRPATLVIDASVAVTWVIPEALSDHADRVRDTDGDIIAPDLLVVEAANALWRKTA